MFSLFIRNHCWANKGNRMLSEVRAFSAIFPKENVTRLCIGRAAHCFYFQDKIRQVFFYTFKEDKTNDILPQSENSWRRKNFCRSFVLNFNSFTFYEKAMTKLFTFNPPRAPKSIDVTFPSKKPLRLSQFPVSEMSRAEKWIFCQDSAVLYIAKTFMAFICRYV